MAKRKGENYQLFWREDRADFVRLAAKFDAVIVPFAAVGGDDAFDLFLVSRAALKLALTAEPKGTPMLGGGVCVGRAATRQCGFGDK